MSRIVLGGPFPTAQQILGPLEIHSGCPHVDLECKSHGRSGPSVLLLQRPLAIQQRYKLRSRKRRYSVNDIE